MVRAKFKVTEKAMTMDGDRITMLPVTGGSPENAEFYKWTPGGSLTLGTVNKAASEKLELGKEYYLDFTPAEG